MESKITQGNNHYDLREELCESMEDLGKQQNTLQIFKKAWVEGLVGDPASYLEIVREKLLDGHCLGRNSLLRVKIIIIIIIINVYIKLSTRPIYFII